MKILILLTLLIPFVLQASDDLPVKYNELLKYVQRAPDQGETSACLYIASTGAMELIANKKYNIKNPKPYGPYDLAESYLINASYHSSAYGKSFWESAVLKFNWGYGILFKDWPFDAWSGSDIDYSIWRTHNWAGIKKVTLPKLETVSLFIKGNRWSTNVLNSTHIKKIKEALWKYRAPVMVNYNDNDYWHVILIVGYDDTLPGECYEISNAECGGVGSFYVRDSFGPKVEVRDYDWFRIKGNAAFVVKGKE